MQQAPAGPAAIPQANFETWLVRFDRDGACASPVSRAALLARLAVIPDTPVILFSHGWNNEYSDASELYAKFLKEVDVHIRARPLAGPKPLFVGVIWPSTWLSWDQGLQIAATPEESAPLEQAVEASLADGLTDQAEREELYRLLATQKLTEEEGARLASLISQSLASTGAQREGREATAPEAADVLAALKALQPTEEPEAGDTLPEGGALDGGPAGSEPQAASILRFLDPRVAIRVASVYQMKDRAGTVGYHGVARLVEDILRTSTAPLHLVGHSYGGKVVLSAIAGADYPGTRKVESALLLQPAISHLSFAASIEGEAGGGGYKTVLAKVRRRILTTYSAFDVPLHDLFHHALIRARDLGEAQIAGEEGTSAGAPPSLFAALGGYGPRGADETLCDFLPEPGQAFEIADGPGVIGLDGTAKRQVMGHGDVATAATAWLLYLQLAGGG